MNKDILNENFQRNEELIDTGKGLYIYNNKKKFYDLSQSSGVLLFGHNHNNFIKSLKNVLSKKITISSKPSTYSIKLFKLIKFFFPNFKKIVFCTTGSESVIKSLRIAKSLNPKKKYLISVAGSWHGSVDQTLFIPNQKNKPLPLSQGIDDNLRKNIKFVSYQDLDKTKKILDKFKKNSYALIIEPVMGSLPSHSMKNYLKFLEKYCKQNNIILIFDEIVTGFRTDQKSVQNLYKLKPDITLIGKILGGGVPISGVGISKKISSKITDNVFFGGTFSGNAISTYIAYKNLLYIKKNLKKINELSKKCRIFQEKINKYIFENKLDAKVYRFCNVMRIVFSSKDVKNRSQRDFLEKNKLNSKKKFIKFLYKYNIYYPSNGIIFLPVIIKNFELQYLIKIISEGLKKI